MAQEDARRVVGGKVEAKALHVTSDAEFACRYGNQKRTKMIPGIGVDAEAEQKPHNKRVTWFVTADYDCSADVMKRKRLNTRSVKAAPQAPAAETTPTATEAVDPTTLTTATTGVVPPMAVTTQMATATATQHRPTTKGEILKFFLVMILMTKIEFGASAGS